jgi:hypothetical protein
LIELQRLAVGTLCCDPDARCYPNLSDPAALPGLDKLRRQSFSAARAHVDNASRYDSVSCSRNSAANSSCSAFLTSTNSEGRRFSTPAYHSGRTQISNIQVRFRTSSIGVHGSDRGRPVGVTPTATAAVILWQLCGAPPDCLEMTGRSGCLIESPRWSPERKLRIICDNIAPNICQHWFTRNLPLWINLNSIKMRWAR